VAMFFTMIRENTIINMKIQANFFIWWVNPPVLWFYWEIMARFLLASVKTMVLANVFSSIFFRSQVLKRRGAYLAYSQAQEKIFLFSHTSISDTPLTCWRMHPWHWFSPIRSITSTDFIQEMLRRIKLANAPSHILNSMKNVDSLIQVDFMSIMTFQVALNACSASIITLLKGAKIALECRTFKPDAAHCIREAPKSCRESQISSGRSSEIPDAAGASKIRMAHFPRICHSICVRERIVCYKSLNFSIIPVKFALRSALAKLWT